MLTFVNLETRGKLFIIHPDLSVKCNREIGELFIPCPYDFIVHSGEIVFVVETFSVKRSDFAIPFSDKVSKIITSQGIAFVFNSWIENFSTEIS